MENNSNLENYLGKIVHVIIDRPIGSFHPEYKELQYTLNYGYIPNTISGDKEPIDVYVLGKSEPVKQATGKVIAVIKRENDIEDKLVISCDKKKKYSKEEIWNFIQFQEKYFTTELIVNGEAFST